MLKLPVAGLFWLFENMLVLLSAPLDAGSRERAQAPHGRHGLQCRQMTWKHILAGLCGFGLGFWICMPRDVVLLPRYEVLVQDAFGKGFPLAEVREFRQDYAITAASTSSLAAADSYGRAAFPPV